VSRFLALALFVAFALSPAQAETHWTLVKSYPHDNRAFTQGLIFLEGMLYESTGQRGRSQIREVRLKDGKVLRSISLDKAYFGEGMTNWDGDLISFTWRARTGFRWDRKSFAHKATWSYSGEGWGLTQDGKRLIMSDGTDQIRFLDPVNYQETGHIKVTWQGQPVRLLNELEYVKGEILANVWMTNRIARIDPKSGAVIDWIDLSSLAKRTKLSHYDAVLNGIAYDAVRDRLFVTGKLWPKLYEIQLKR